MYSDNNCKVLHKYSLRCEIQWRGLDFTPLWIYMLNHLVHISICYLYPCSYKLNRGCLVDTHIYWRQILKIGAPYPHYTLRFRMPKNCQELPKLLSNLYEHPQNISCWAYTAIDINTKYWNVPEDSALIFTKVWNLVPLTKFHT